MTDDKKYDKLREIEVDCDYCDGEGQYPDKHPSWGLPWCPEDSILVECGECDGTGKMLIEVDDNGGRV